MRKKTKPRVELHRKEKEHTARETPQRQDPGDG